MARVKSKREKERELGQTRNVRVGKECNKMNARIDTYKTLHIDLMVGIGIVLLSHQPKPECNCIAMSSVV